ncbi:MULTISPECIES: SgcJ/EcaC family oxidoreductase [Paraburkholderia]|uniref:SgcJ/EcaC family oxidoreductase n=1 Tax=Paraburkholderia unamae TaxID=219649 RepID=A0ACC6RNZ0_9BURK
MTDDERAIREMVQTWMEASRAGDTAKVLSLMTDDVVFTVPGQEPFGKAEFAAASQAQQDMRIEGTAEIVELQVLGNWAFLRNRIDISVKPPGAAQPMRRAGYTLTLVRKDASGRWLLARDANLVAPKT